MDKGETNQDNLKEHLLIDLHELLVPLINVGCLLAVVGILLLGDCGVVLVMFAPFEDLLQDHLADLR